MFSIVLAMTSSALACRYTVRELGFVNLQGKPWTLVEVSRATTPSIAEPIDANIGVAIVHPLEDPNHPAVLALDGAEGVVLMGPNGRTKTITGKDPLSQAVTSPLRRRLAEEALDTFAFVLMIPGTNEAENEHARAFARTAESRLAALAPHLPRPVSTPLRMIELSPEETEEETLANIQSTN